MAGSPPLGKMSTGIRCNARRAPSAMASRATTMVIGLLRAAKTTRMQTYFCCGHSLACLAHEWLEVSRRGRQTQQCAPNAQMGKGIVDLRLREQALRFRNLIDCAETRFITSRRLLCRGARGGDLHWGVCRNFSCAAKLSERDIPPCS